MLNRRDTMRLGIGALAGVGLSAGAAVADAASLPVSRTPHKDTFHIPENDGWTMPGYLAELPRVHSELRFTYRPTLVTERSKIIASMRGKESHVQDAELGKSLACYIKSWSIEVDGKPQPITAEFISRLKYQVWDRLIAIVIYSSGVSDRDPECDSATKRLLA